MNASEWLAVGGIVAGLMLALPVIRWAALRLGTSPEVARKAVHVAMGLACVGFPWVFDRPLPVWVLAVIATALLGLLRVVPGLRSGIGSAVYGVTRFSYGEVLFAPAVAAVFQGAQGDRLLHVIPIGILTIADAAGALAGTRWGRRRYGCGEGFKTVEGSMIFLATAFLCVFVPLIMTGRTDGIHGVWIGLILATLAMMAEGISDRGFDNLVVPLGCFFVLERLLPLETPALAGRLIAVLLLLALVIWGGRWSSLNGGALLGSALLGYGCAVLADWRFALPPVAVFVCHVVVTRRHQLTKAFDHRLDTVLAHAIGCLPWVLLAGGGHVPRLTGLAGVSFAMAAQLALLDAATRVVLGESKPSVFRSTLKGWCVAGLPGLIWFWPNYGRLSLPAAIAVTVTLFLTRAFLQMRPRFQGHDTGLRLFKGFLAFATSLSALLVSP